MKHKNVQNGGMTREILLRYDTITVMEAVQVNRPSGGALDHFSFSAIYGARCSLSGNDLKDSNTVLPSIE